MFGNKIGKSELVAIVDRVCREYIQKIDQGSVGIESLEDQILYLSNAYQQARGIDMLSRELCSFVNDEKASLLTGGLVLSIKNTVDGLIEQLDNEEQTNT